MSQYQQAKETIVATARRLVEKGYLMATGGNLSVRITGQNCFAVTPSNYDYMLMTPEDVCILDFNLNVIEGALKPSVESSLHCAIYQVRADVQAVIHTHQVYASALALMKTPIPALFDEQVRFLGRSVDLIPYAPSGTGFLKKEVARSVGSHNKRLHYAESRCSLFRTRYAARRTQCGNSREVFAGLPADSLR